MNPWHDVPVDTGSPGIVHAYIETPGHADAKFELVRRTGLLRLKGAAFQELDHPVASGLIPRTRTAAGEPLDILVFSGVQLIHGCLLPAEVRGVIEMREKDGISHVIIAEAEAGRLSRDPMELNGELTKSLLSFLRKYRTAQRRTIFSETVSDRRSAAALIRKAAANYRSHYSYC